MHSPFDEEPHYLQVILVFTPDGKALCTPQFFRGK